MRSEFPFQIPISIARVALIECLQGARVKVERIFVLVGFVQVMSPKSCMEGSLFLLIFTFSSKVMSK